MVMFTNAQPSATASVLRQQRDHTRNPISCPEAVLLCNKYMGGVDRYYACKTKSRKFIFYFLFDVAITDAHILQKSFCPKNVHKNVREFRLQLARELMGNYSGHCRAGRRPSQITTLPLCHFPFRIPDELHRRNFK